MQTTEQIYDEIMASEVFRLNGAKIDLPEKLMELAQAIKAEEETDWSMGEFSEACLSDLIPGAYWSLTEWHAGQWSPEYAALCALGDIFSPGISCAPESPEDDSCFDAYESCNLWLSKRQMERKAA